MARDPNWQVALQRWAGAQIGRPFRWGETDCHALVLRARELLLGERAPLEWFGYRQARRLYEQGWTPDAGLARLGARSLPLGYARAGDVIVEPEAGRRTGFYPLHIVLGNGLLLTSCQELGSVTTIEWPAVPLASRAWAWP